MRKSAKVGAVAVLFVFVASVVFVGMPVRAEAGPYEWTIAVYGDADNNLEGAWDKYTQPALMGIPANDNIKVVSALDRYSTMGAELIEYTYGGCTVAQSYPEKDFGSADTLVWFIQEVGLRYPSNHLALILWDHGGGWWGVCWDDTDGSYMTENELYGAIVDAGVYIDVLAFDACMMSGIEVVYDMCRSGLVGMMVSSEQLVPYNGFPYDLMFAPLAANPYLLKEEVADYMVAGWDVYYGKKGWVDLSAIDVAVIGEVVMDEFMVWKDAMAANLDSYVNEYLKAFKKAEMVKGWYIVDMNIFAGAIALDKKVTDVSLKSACTNLMSAIDEGVNAKSGGGKTVLAGLTLWFGVDGEYTNYGWVYQMLAFAQDTGWYDFMTQVNMY